jgi:putative flavoprotein involved in K+ transport
MAGPSCLAIAADQGRKGPGRLDSMASNMNKQTWGTVVIGAGQAGLATGYYLAQGKEDLIILDAGSRTGDAWRRRWDSLQLFTPAHHDGLPGFPFPAVRGSFPTKDEMADYLETYANRFSLPVKLDTRVIELLRTATGFEVVTSRGSLHAYRVVVATGTNPIARIPDFAKELDPAIFQLHSSQYKNPGSLPGANTLVVGAGTSGVELAIELSKTRSTMIAGHPTPHILGAVFRYAGGLYWWFVHRVLTVRTPLGRLVKKKILNSGGPLIRISFDDLKAAGVTPLPRVACVREGQPQLQDGRVITPDSILWATGFKPDFSWIRMDVTDDSGWPKTRRGVSETIDRLYFAGMPFQYGLTSGLVGGVGRDAAFIARHIHMRSRLSPSS